MSAAVPVVGLYGRLGTPQLACLRSWRRAGVRCVLLHTGPIAPSALVAWLLGVRCVHLGPLALQDPAAVDRLAAVLGTEGVTVLTCVSEPVAEALWACRDRLPAALQIATAQPQATQRLQSKLEQVRLARDCGLQVLPWAMLQPGEPLRRALPQLVFPVVARPDVARRADPPFKLAVLADRSALQRLVSERADGSSPVIVQPLVHGPNLLVHAWRSADGRSDGQLAFHVAHKHRGLTVLMQPVALPDAVAEGCARMAAALDLVGAFHFEFIVDERNGQAYFLDLNPRLGGTTGKALAAGYDEPLALLSTLAGNPWQLDRADFVATRLRPAGAWHQALAALASALRERSSAADHPYPHRGRLLRVLGRQLLLARDEVLRADMPRSTLGFALQKLSQRRGQARATGLAGDGASSSR